MLILRRKKNESFLIGNNVRITIVDCAADGVRVAIDAPKHISILREELSEAEQTNINAVVPSIGSLRSLQHALSPFIAHNSEHNQNTDIDEKENQNSR